jgi:hypothetical protein
VGSLGSLGSLGSRLEPVISEAVSLRQTLKMAVVAVTEERYVVLCMNVSEGVSIDSNADRS